MSRGNNNTAARVSAAGGTRRFIVNEKAASSRRVLIHQRAEHQVRGEHHVQRSVQRIILQKPSLAPLFFSLFFLRELFHASAVLGAGCIKMSLFSNVSFRWGWRGEGEGGVAECRSETASCDIQLLGTFEKPNWGKRQRLFASVCPS